jgi:ubiquinone/menaquinone biosynthesis C-methylase UbiE
MFALPALSDLTWHILTRCLAYIYPNDEQELDRLDMQHHMYKMVLDNKLFHVPLKDPKRILDIGTGSGIWPIEMGTFTRSDSNILV